MLTGKWIAEWLNTHEILTLNGFGVFKCEEKPSYIHPVEHSFSPPTRNISFIFDKRANDSLLIDAMSSSFSVTSKKAETAIKSFIQHITEKLNTEKKCEVKDLGTFISQGNSILFTADINASFNAKNYGLSEFKTSFIRRNNKAEPPIKKKKRKLTKGFIWLIISIIFIGFFAFALYYFDIYNQIFGSKNQTPIPTKDTLVISNKSATNQITQDTNTLDTSDVNNKTEVYYIIYGCYKEESNAQKAIKQLKEKGYPNGIICGTNNNGFYKVSYGVYSTKEEAEAALTAIKEKGPTEAWITK